jgi:hypothetical protein
MRPQTRDLLAADRDAVAIAKATTRPRIAKQFRSALQMPIRSSWGFDTPRSPSAPSAKALSTW